MSPQLYFSPPDGYTPPTRCEQCGSVIIFGPVIGGHIWMHIVRLDHDVVMREEGWWDVRSGGTRYSNGLDEVLKTPYTGETIL